MYNFMISVSHFSCTMPPRSSVLPFSGETARPHIQQNFMAGIAFRLCIAAALSHLHRSWLSKQPAEITLSLPLCFRAPVLQESALPIGILQDL